jgi:predicted nucleic acid-binding protein
VVNETLACLCYDGGLGAARDLRARIGALCDLRWACIIWIDEQLEAAGWRILEHCADIQLSLTDATSAVAARAYRITAISGFDADCQALGLVVTPALL